MTSESEYDQLFLARVEADFDTMKLNHGTAFTFELAHAIIAEIDAGRLTWYDAIMRNLIPIVYSEEQVRSLIANWTKRDPP